MITTNLSSIFYSIAVICILAILPLILKRIGQNSKGGLLYIPELILAIGIFLAFIATWQVTVVAYYYVGPFMFGIDMKGFSIDGQITPRILAYILFVFSTPLLILSKVGFVSVRDIHQICKENRDKRQNLGVASTKKQSGNK